MHQFTANDDAGAVHQALQNVNLVPLIPASVATTLLSVVSTVFQPSNPGYRGANPHLLLITSGLTGESVEDLASAVGIVQDSGIQLAVLGVAIRGDIGTRVLAALTSDPTMQFRTSSTDTVPTVQATVVSMANALGCSASSEETTTTPGPLVVCNPSTDASCSCPAQCTACYRGTEQCTACSSTTALFQSACVAACPVGFSAVRSSTMASYTCMFDCSALDVLFVLDGSGSVSPSLFANMKAFVNAVGAQLPLSSFGTRYVIMHCICIDVCMHVCFYVCMHGCICVWYKRWKCA